MNSELVGQVLKKIRTKAYAAKMAELEQTLGTESAADTARVALFFGATATRDMEIVEKMGLVLERALMVGHEIQWSRPFVPDEDVDVTVSLKDVQAKGDKSFGVIESVYATPSGEEIQRQLSTFVEFEAPAG